MQVNNVEQQRMLMDLDISMRSSDCPFTVHFYGAMFREGDVWICMEVMDTSALHEMLPDARTRVQNAVCRHRFPEVSRLRSCFLYDARSQFPLY